MIAPLSQTPVPRTVDIDGDHIVVRRAWPRPKGDELRITFEGRDSSGAVRAGEWRPVRRLARVLPSRQDPALPGLSDLDPEARLLVHRHRRRAVLSVPGEGGEAGSFVKVLAGDRADRVAALTELVNPLAADAGFSVPRITVQDSRIESSALPGETLTHWASAEGSGGWESGWQEWARRWPAFVNQPVPENGAVTLPAWEVADEARMLTQWVERMLMLRAPEGVASPDPEVVTARLDEVVAALGELPSATPVLAHRDLHDGQLLWTGEGRLGLLDLDTCATADPALDLGNLLAHVDWLEHTGELDPVRRESAADGIREVAVALGVEDKRLAAWTDAARLRICAVHAFRPRTRQAAYGWLELTVGKARAA